MSRKHILTITLTETYRPDSAEEAAEFAKAIDQTITEIRDMANRMARQFLTNTVRVKTERNDA